MNLTGQNYDVVFASMPPGADEMIYQEINSVYGFDADDFAEIKAAENTSMWVLDQYSNGPFDEREEDLVGQVSGLNFELDKEYIVVVSYNDAGEIAADVMELGTPAMEDTFMISVSHYGMGADPVDILNLDTMEVAIDDLAYGVTSDSLELAVSGEYNFGLDVDQDGVSDFDFAIAADDFLAGERVNVSAYFDLGIMSLGITAIDAEGSVAFFSVETGILAPPPEPMTVDEILANLPYSSNGYLSYESAGLYDRSTIQIQAPEGTTSITLTLDYDVEQGWDYVAIFDGEGARVSEGTDADGNTVATETRFGREGFAGSQTGFTVVIPGDYALVGIESDSGTEYDGYIITAIEVQ